MADEGAPDSRNGTGPGITANSPHMVSGNASESTDPAHKVPGLKKGGCNLKEISWPPVDPKLTERFRRFIAERGIVLESAPVANSCKLCADPEFVVEEPPRKRTRTETSADSFASELVLEESSRKSTRTVTSAYSFANYETDLGQNADASVEADDIVKTSESTPEASDSNDAIISFKEAADLDNPANPPDVAGTLPSCKESSAAGDSVDSSESMADAKDSFI